MVLDGGVGFGGLPIEAQGGQGTECVDPVGFHSLSYVDATFGGDWFVDELQDTDVHVLGALVSLRSEMAADRFVVPVLALEVTKVHDKSVLEGGSSLTHILDVASSTGNGVDDIGAVACDVSHTVVRFLGGAAGDTARGV